MQYCLQTCLINVDERGESVLLLAAVNLQSDPQHVYDRVIIEIISALQEISFFNS